MTATPATPANHSTTSKTVQPLGNKIEWKVVLSTAGSLVAGLIVALLNYFLGNSQALGKLPGWAQFIIIVLGPTLLTALAGYATKHTERADL